MGPDRRGTCRDVIEVAFVSRPKQRSTDLAWLRERARRWIGDSTPETAIGEELLAHHALWAADEIERLRAALELFVKQWNALIR